MNPFARKVVKSQPEKDELLRQADAEWNQLCEVSDLVSQSQEDYLAAVSDSIEIESPAFVAPRQLSKAEKDQLDVDIILSQMRYDAHPYDDLPGALRSVAEEKQRAELEELLGPAIRERNSLEAMFEKAVATALTKRAGTRSEVVRGHSIPIRQTPERETILVKLADRAEEENAGSLLSKWLRGYVAGDEQAMRRVVGELVAEAA